MSENAERPARSGRESGEKERPTASSVLITAAILTGEKERPTASSVLITAAILTGIKERPTASSVLIPAAILTGEEERPTAASAQRAGRSQSKNRRRSAKEAAPAGLDHCPLGPIRERSLSAVINPRRG